MAAYGGAAMTTDPTIIEPAGDRPGHSAEKPPPAAAFWRCPAVATKHRHHRQGVAGRLRGAPGVDGDRVEHALGPAADRSGGRRPAAPDSTPAYRVAHPDHERHRPGRLGLGGDSDRRRAHRGAHGAQALAPPVHVPGQFRGAGVRGRHRLQPLPAAPPLRRHHHRTLGRLHATGTARGVW